MGLRIKKSCSNLAGLMGEGVGEGFLTHRVSSKNSIDSMTEQTKRLFLVAHKLPIRANWNEVTVAWEFELDEDALLVQAKEGIEGFEVYFVGCQPDNVHMCKEVSVKLKALRCIAVDIDEDLRIKFYKGCCKQLLWPLLHYALPLSPNSAGRFNSDVWQAYMKANMEFAKVLHGFVMPRRDFVWIHDYHLLVLPSLLRMHMEDVRCGFFLHSPFPSSEIFRTFPKRIDILRSLLNADLIGFQTFDYARHFLSCCVRMLGIEHKTFKGKIGVEYYGRNVEIKIMPTGINPDRFLSGFEWPETEWRRGELLAEYANKTVLIGVDDMDPFKGIDLKLKAFARVLELQPEWRGSLCLIQITNKPKAAGRDVQELVSTIQNLVRDINQRFGTETYQPVTYLERNVVLHERIAFYSIADCLLLTATRDGMNLAPYEYVACRQGVKGIPNESKTSMIILSEFVGCSPSLCGALRVNPWSAAEVADGIRGALAMSLPDQQFCHAKHWKYISEHTVAYWAQSFTYDLVRVTEIYSKITFYRMGLGIDTFKIIALDRSFRQLNLVTLVNVYKRSNRRLFFLDYDGTLIPSSNMNPTPPERVMAVLKQLCSDPINDVYIISGRSRKDLDQWFGGVERLGLAAEHGYFYRPIGSKEWHSLSARDDFSWKGLVQPIFEQYTDATDGSTIEVKESALVWRYRDADKDFGNWQAKELLNHLEEILTNEPLETVAGHYIIEVKPSGVNKGQVVERILTDSSKDAITAPDFVLCLGDDRSDEKMYNALDNIVVCPHMPAEVFACTVGQKPSKARFYVDGTDNVITMLEKLSETT